MNPKSIITVTAQSLPMILKYQGKEYVVKSTSNGSLHMIKDSTEIDPNPAQVIPEFLAKFGDENE